MQIATLCIVLIYLSRVNVLSLLHTNKQFRLQLYHVKTLFLPKPSSPYPRLMKLSDNFRLIKVLPDVPPVVPLDLCLGVHLEVLTSSHPT